MKKVVSIILIMILLVSLNSMAFATKSPTIEDFLVPRLVNN